MQILIEAINDNTENVRRVLATPAQDAALRDSIASLGVVQPIVVRQVEPGSFVVVAGARRLRAARELGHETIPAEILDVTNGHALAVATAENTVRAGMDPVDQWRAIEQLQAQGYTLQGAAQAIGVSEAMGRRMSKLASLHPDVLAALAGHGLPRGNILGRIASAPPDKQKTAYKAARKKAGDNNTEQMFSQMAELCRVTRISQQVAIFDIKGSGVAFDEDLFAEPGSADQFTTADVAGFMKCQLQACKERVKRAAAAKQAVEYAEWDEKKNNLSPPPGFVATYEQPGKKPPKINGDKVLLIGITPADEHNAGKIIERIVVRKATAAKPAKTTSSAGDQDDAADDADEARPKPKPETHQISAAGLNAIASAKTAALHTALREPNDDVESMLLCCVLALAATNISVAGYDGRRPPFVDLVSRLLDPAGVAALTTPAELVAIAGEALARSLHLTSPKDAQRSYSGHSGSAAEWVGYIQRADDHLPRFDTAEFLAEVGGAKLRELCTEAGIKPRGSVADLRRALTGALPKWRPSAFGAPVPVHLAADCYGDIYRAMLAAAPAVPDAAGAGG